MYRRTMGCLLWVIAAALVGCDDEDSVADAPSVLLPDSGTPLPATCPDWSPDSIRRLPVGRLEGSLDVSAGTMVVGQGTDTVLAGGPDEATVTLHEGSALCNLTVEGGRVGVEARGVGRVTLTDVHVRGATAVGVRFDGVEMAELVDVSISDVGPLDGAAPARGMGHLVVHSSVVGMARGAIGPGTVPGVVVDWADDAPPETCEGQWSGCPFSGAVGLRDVDLGPGDAGEWFALAAVDARHGAIRISGGRVRAGAPAGREPDGRAIRADLRAPPQTLPSGRWPGRRCLYSGKMSIAGRLGSTVRTHRSRGC